MKKLLLILSLCLIGCSPTYPEAKWPGENGKELLKICWDNGRALSEHACQDPKYVEWDHAPLTVSADPSIAGMVLQSVKAWNEILGFRLFIYKKLDAEADIIFARGGAHPTIRGVTMFFKPGNRMRAGILMFDDAVNSMGTYLHELGHAVGLRHDARDTRSIMYPNNGRYFPRVQVIDKKLLIDRYKDIPKNIQVKK